MQVRKLAEHRGGRRAAVAFVAGAGFAQSSYPSQPIRVIIPLAPGGAIDVMVRALGKAFEQRNQHGFVVESRAGANTIIAANACKAAPPDGYTICLLSRSSVSLNPDALQEPVLRSAAGTSSRSPISPSRSRC